MNLSIRNINEIYNYWYEAKANKPLPSYNDINQDYISRWINDCFLIKINKKSEDNKLHFQTNNPYSVVYVGENIADIYEKPPIKDNKLPKQINEINSNYPLFSNIDYVEDTLKDTTKLKEPILDENEIYDINDRVIKYKQCLLPLGDDKHGVSLILGFVVKNAK